MVALTPVPCSNADYVVSALQSWLYQHHNINYLKDRHCLRINILYLVVKQAGSQCRRIKAGVMWSNQDPWFFTDVTGAMLASPPTQMLAMFTLVNCCQVDITMNSVLNKNESKKGKERLLPFVTTYDPVVHDLINKDIDGKLESHRKFASAEKNL